MGSEMCIRDRAGEELLARQGADQNALAQRADHEQQADAEEQGDACLLYTSDAADERSSVDLGGRRIIKKKKN